MTTVSGKPLLSGASIAFIGLGRMGWPMARRLSEAGYRLRVFDVRPEQGQAFSAEYGGHAAGSVAEAARSADAVITVLPNSAIVHDVAPSLLEAMRAGSLLIEMTSGLPMVTRDLARDLAARGVATIDAPVSGGVRGAEEGRLAIMVGGESGDLDRARPVLACLGAKVFHVGALGAGQAMKALNNLVSASGLAAAAEAISIGKRFGLDPAVMVDILNASTGRNNATENKFKPFILSGSYAGGFALDLMVKDLETAIGLADETTTPASLSRSCLDLWSDAKSGLPPGSDHTEIARWLDLAAETRSQAAE